MRGVSNINRICSLRLLFRLIRYVINAANHLLIFGSDGSPLVVQGGNHRLPNDAFPVRATREVAIDCTGKSLEKSLGRRFPRSVIPIKEESVTTIDHGRVAHTPCPATK